MTMTEFTDAVLADVMKGLQPDSPSAMGMAFGSISGLALAFIWQNGDADLFLRMIERPEGIASLKEILK